MFIELIDLLRCTRAHEDSWLVATFHEMRERDVIEGLLSCPVCRARYPITGGVTWFDVAPGTGATGTSVSAEDGMRLAAYLNLVESGVVLLEGTWASAADGIARLGSTVLALNSPEIPGEGRISRLRSADIVPLARECLDGIALSSDRSDVVESGARALKNGARMVARAAAPVPEGLVEIARDEGWWVAAREGASASAPVQIARR